MQTINERVFSLLEKGDINWSVRKIQLTAPEGLDRPKAHGIYAGTQYLGTVGDQYTAVQNSKLAEIFIKALDRVGLECETSAGHISDRKKVYMQAKLPDRFVGPDKLKRNLTALNSHDGSTAAAFGTTNTVVICTNTFYAALKNMPKTRHTANVLDRIKVTADGIAAAMAAELGMMDTFDKMAQEMITPATVGGLINSLFGVDPEAKLDGLSTRKKNQLTAFADAINLETRPDRHGKTVWGLFNAVTYYTNHVAKPEKYTKMEYLMDRTGNKLNNKAYNHLAKQLVTSFN